MLGGARLSLPPAVNTASPSATRPNSGESAMKLKRGRRSPPKPSSTPVSRVYSMGASVLLVVVLDDVAAPASVLESSVLASSALSLWGGLEVPGASVVEVVVVVDVVVVTS